MQEFKSLCAVVETTTNLQTHLEILKRSIKTPNESVSAWLSFKYTYIVKVKVKTYS